MKKQNGLFIISLDFELFWGQFDKVKFNNYRKNIIGTEVAVLRLLSTFKKYNISCSWATVGFVLSNPSEFKSSMPKITPSYANKRLCPYSYFDKIAEGDKKYFFSPKLVEKIDKTRGQELCSHTYSHYYSKEKGQNINEFEHDLISQSCILKNNNYKNPLSIVFPRNQVNNKYFEILYKYGYKTFRGNQDNLIYKENSKNKIINYVLRLIRFFDSYINISGNNTYYINMEKLLNIKQSAFLRPFNSRLKYFEKIKINRIKKSMLSAAIQKKVYHLWWHPHNFGTNIDENFRNLESILDYYVKLNKEYGFESKNMRQVYNDLQS